MDVSASSWNIPPALIVLENDEVHVWRAMLNLSRERMQALEQTLAGDEHLRARKFRFQKDRDHFVAARGQLRAILGRYLNKDARALRFSYNQYGKPALAGDSGSSPLFFNTTHSHEMALIAVTRAGEIGVDLEFIKSNVESLQIAQRFFSANEVTMLSAVPEQLQHEAFYNCWTRKEAYIKARGMGLSLDLHLFDVSLTPGMPPAILDSREADHDITRWSLYDLPAGAGYKAALAVEGRPRMLALWQWSAVA